MLNDLQMTLSQFVTKAGLMPPVSRVRIHRDRCVVVDVTHRGVSFGFDVTPVEPQDGAPRYSCSIVERKHTAGVALLKAGKRKKMLAASLPLDAVQALIAARIPALTGRITKSLKAATPAAAPAATAAAQPLTKAARQAQRKAARKAGRQTGQPAAAAAAGRRVGVMTLPLNGNYGGNLQSFALMQALRKLGHEPLFINRRHPKGEDLPPVDTRAPVLGRSIGLPKTLPNTSFTDRWLQPMTRRFLSSEDLAANADRLGLDAIITGSDQVWRPRYAKAALSDLFLGFLPKNSPVRRLSYAPSFGAETWEYKEAQTRRAATLVQRFDAISVREDSAVDLARTHLGVTAQHVLDPTLLLDPADYAPVIAEAKRIPEPGRVLTYLFDPDAEKSAMIAGLAEALGTRAETTSGAAFPGSGTAGPDEDKTVQGWLAAFQAAAFVVTDSFHGVAFSILFNKPFVVFGHQKRGMARFRSILKLVGLEDRLIADDATISVAEALTPIDWAAVNAKLAEKRAESFRFLQDGVTGPGATGPGETGPGAGRQRAKSPEATSPEAAGPEAAGDKEPAKGHPFTQNARTLALHDSARFASAFLTGNRTSRARARLMYYAHALEKGLSHTKFRAGFGKNPMAGLAKETRLWLRAGDSLDDPFFVAAISALHSYFRKHAELGHDVSAYHDAFTPAVQALIAKADDQHGGAVSAETLRNPAPTGGRSFNAVVHGRRSVREFTNRPVALDLIEQAVHVAAQAPSVCNRQGPRTHYFTDPGQIGRLVDLQGGFRGYAYPPALLLVTCDLTSFITASERNQGFIDGGLFMMNLLLGLENLGLAACPLNAAMNTQQERDIRGQMTIPDNEVLISFIAVGHHDPAVLVPRSLRFPVSHLLSVHGAR